MSYDTKRDINDIVMFRVINKLNAKLVEIQKNQSKSIEEASKLKLDLSKLVARTNSLEKSISSINVKLSNIIKSITIGGVGW